MEKLPGYKLYLHLWDGEIVHGVTECWAEDSGHNLGKHQPRHWTQWRGKLLCWQLCDHCVIFAGADQWIEACWGRWGNKGEVRQWRQGVPCELLRSVTTKAERERVRMGRDLQVLTKSPMTWVLSGPRAHTIIHHISFLWGHMWCWELPFGTVLRKLLTAAN